MAQKPSIPKGTRDFNPLQTARRNYIFDTIRKAFNLYGYKQIETPAMENISTLMGKYGDEGDKLLFKILNSGDWMRSCSDQEFIERNYTHLASNVCEKGLRYDLTVPFARFVVQHRNDITFPFKRSQIQSVWRADRPQKGRYREFTQCDADVIGSDSLLCEVELLSLIDYVFTKLGISITIKLNNRKILAAVAEMIGHQDKIIDITVAIDKIEKIGLDKVEDELREAGITESGIASLRPLLTLKGSNEDKLQVLQGLLNNIEVGQQGVEELRYVVNTFNTLTNNCTLDIDVSLARGLNYYTGCIVEVKANDVQIGSITGGGRYDNLTDIFGMPDISGVGISFGADRIYDVLTQLNLFPENLSNCVKVMFVNFGNDDSVIKSVQYVNELRLSGISAQLYPDNVKIKKQMQMANNEGLSYIAMVGEEEISANKLTLKNMKTGEQLLISICEAKEILSK